MKNLIRFTYLYLLCLIDMYVENILSISFSCSEKVNKYDSMESCESLKSDHKVALNKNY